MDLLLSVARTGSIAQAAKAHGISQPSASAKLSLLERRTGVVLLERSTTGARLTPSGETVAAWAADVLNAAQALNDGLQSLRSNVDARLTISASLTVAEYLLPRWLQQMRTKHPSLQLAATVSNSRDVLEQVRNGSAEIGFIEAPEIPSELASRPVGTDEVILAVAPDHLLRRGTNEDLSPYTVLELPLLLREPGSGTRDAFLQSLARALGRAVPPSLPYATTLGSTATLLASAKAGAGVAVVSARAAERDIEAGLLTSVRVRELQINRPLTAVWRPHRLSAAAGDLVRIAASDKEI